LNFYLPSKQQFINLKWCQENLIYAKVGYHLIKRLSQDTLGRKTLSSPEGVFHVLGVTFVENQDNIFHHKKSFLQDIRDLLEKEARFLEKQGKLRAQKNRNTVRQSTNLHREPQFGGSLLSNANGEPGRNTSVAGASSMVSLGGGPVNDGQAGNANQQ